MPKASGFQHVLKFIDAQGLEIQGSQIGDVAPLEIAVRADEDAGPNAHGLEHVLEPEEIQDIAEDPVAVEALSGIQEVVLLLRFHIVQTITNCIRI